MDGIGKMYQCWATNRTNGTARCKAGFCGSLLQWHGASSGCGWRNGLLYGGKLRIYWISSCEQPTRGGLPAWGLGEVLTTPHLKKKIAILRKVHNFLGLGLILWCDLSNGEGTWDLVGGMLGACIAQGQLMIVARELARCKLDLVGVQGVRWDKGGTLIAGNYIFSMEKETKIINWEQDICTTQGSINS